MAKWSPREIGVPPSALRRLFVLAATAVLTVACSSGGSPSATEAEWSAALDRLTGAIGSSTGYSPGSIEIIGSPVHLRIAISDPKLAHADQATRESTALAVVAAAEQAMGSNVHLASVKELSVAIIHPEGFVRAAHTEDVMDFERRADQRFAPDVL